MYRWCHADVAFVLAMDAAWDRGYQRWYREVYEPQERARQAARERRDVELRPMRQAQTARCERRSGYNLLTGAARCHKMLPPTPFPRLLYPFNRSLLFCCCLGSVRAELLIVTQRRLREQQRIVEAPHLHKRWRRS